MEQVSILTCRGCTGTENLPQVGPSSQASHSHQQPGRACIPSLPAKPKITFRTREDQARQRVRYRLQTPSRYVELQCGHCSKASSNRSSRTKCGLRNIFCHFAASDGTIFPWKGWHSLLTSVHHDSSLRARFHVRRAAGPLLIT